MEPVNIEKKSPLRHVDWVTIFIYLGLVIAGVLSIYAASYDFDHASIFSFAEYSGKQIRWIGLALVLGLVVLLVDARVWETYAYPIYLVMLLLLVATIFISPNIQGSHSWIKIGSMSIQPAEFAKISTALALAKLCSSYNFTLTATRANFIKAIAIIFVPVLIILGQNETGSALAYMALFFVLYREGMSGLVLLAAIVAIAIFVVAVKYSAQIILGIPAGQAIIMGLLAIGMVVMTATYAKRPIEARNMLLWFLLVAAVGSILTLLNVQLSGYIYFGGGLLVAILYSLAIWLHHGLKRMATVVAAVTAALLFLFSVNFAFGVLQPHQQLRIKVAVGLDEDPRGAGYNVNQSKIAIGSGGVFGKGFLNGTQTKLKYVPEQHTDFIFCTIGEEEGFVGAAVVLVAFLALILRVLRLAERQPTTFGRVYGYCVASYFIFHLTINVGMVIGLCPVIGIPLPFFSYGGSSLWGFTLLLFILLRLDAARKA